MLKYDMKIRGGFPEGDYHPGMTGVDFVRSGVDKFDKWALRMLCQEKLDGWFGIVIKDESGCYWDNGWEKYVALQGMLKVFDEFMPVGSIIIGEVGYGTEAETLWAEKHGYNRFIMFDVIQWGGKWLLDMDSEHRFLYLQDIWTDSKYSKIEHPQIDLVRSIMLSGTDDENKEAAWRMFLDITGNGGEGVILKLADSMYKIHGESNGMFKIKKYITKDYVCMGFLETDAPTFLAKGMKVASIQCGLYVNGELKLITQTGAFPFDWRKEFTDNPDKYIGKVVELGGFEVFKSGAMRHSMFLRFREDRVPEDCIL